MCEIYHVAEKRKKIKLKLNENFENIDFLLMLKFSLYNHVQIFSLFLKSFFVHVRIEYK